VIETRRPGEKPGLLRYRYRGLGCSEVVGGGEPGAGVGGSAGFGAASGAGAPGGGGVGWPG
jgi:hypothetical protein